MYKIGLWVLPLLMTGSFDSCDDDEVIYKDSATDDTVVTRLNVSPRNVEMLFTDEKEFTVAVRPVASEIEWETSDPEIAYVNDSNRIVPVGVGNVKFTAKAGNLTDTVTATIHSSIVSDDYAFMEKGSNGGIPTLQIVPENTQYVVESDNEGIVSVSGSQITAVEAGVATLTITAEDGQSRNIVIGVTDAEHTLNAAKAETYTYDGTTLGHVVYNIAALVLSENGVTYTDGGQWSGTGTGLFVKLYYGGDLSAVPDGTYIPGNANADFNYYTDYSYFVDAETGAKENIRYGNIDIASGGVTAQLIAGSSAYVVKFSGQRTETPHDWGEASFTYDYTEADLTRGVVDIDHNGTMFYGGYGNGWRFRLYLSGSDYIQIMIWSKNTDEIAGEYPLDGGFCTQGTIGCMGYGQTSLVYMNSTSNYFSADGSIVSTPGFQREEGTVTLGFQGTFHYSSSAPVDEIGEQHPIANILNLNVAPYGFNVNSER